MGMQMQSYQLNRRIKHHRRLWMAAGTLAALGLLALITYRLLHVTAAPATTVHNAPPLSTNYVSSSPLKVRIDNPAFSMRLPAGWQAVPVTANVNIPSYSYKSPNAQAQQLDVFIDHIPTAMAVNRVVTVSARGAGMDHENVSDNCVTFTPGSDTTSGVANGKWQGTNFLCDEGNYERDVVGLASSEGINFVTLTGPLTGAHKVFMAYTNNNNNPDFSALYGVLESFNLK